VIAKASLFCFFDFLIESLEIFIPKFLYIIITGSTAPANRKPPRTINSRILFIIFSLKINRGNPVVSSSGLVHIRR